MPTSLSRVILVWPVMLPGSGELRSEIDCAVDDVTMVREDDGALVLTRGGDVVRIARPEFELAIGADGSFERVHDGASAKGVQPTVVDGAMVLFRPVGAAELALIDASGFRAFPPRLPEQPIFYPVTNEAYAQEIAERWNGPEGQGVHVVRFAVDEAVAARWLPVRCVGARHHTELWIPAEDLPDLNASIQGTITVLAADVESPDELALREQWFDTYCGQLDDSVMHAPRPGLRFACPCCRSVTLDARGVFDICPVCFWEDDGQDDHDAGVVRGGPNGPLSLEAARANYLAFGACDERTKRFVREAKPHERAGDE